MVITRLSYVVSSPLRIQIRVRPISSNTIIRARTQRLKGGYIYVDRGRNVIVRFFRFLASRDRASSAYANRIFRVRTSIVPSRFFRSAASASTRRASMQLIVRVLVKGDVRGSASIRDFPQGFLVDFLRAISTLNGLRLFAIIVLVERIRRMRGFAFANAFRGIMRATRKVATIGGGGLLCLSLRRYLSREFSRTTRVDVNSLIQGLGVLQRFLGGHAFLTGTLGRLRQYVFASMVCRSHFSSLPSSDVSECT